MKIPLVVVDDREEDRYLVKRYIARTNDFDDPVEVSSGNSFLERFFDEAALTAANRESEPRTLLVLMDINMPGLDGFETIEEAQRRLANGQGPERLIFLMFSSSENANDMARANSLDSVKGYIPKPLTGESVEVIRKLYFDH